MEEQYLVATRLLDYGHMEMVKKRQHLLSLESSSRDRLTRLYAFVSSLPLGYSKNDNIPASKVLKDGYGQCNTKVILLMALARGSKIPCRVHAYRITKEAQAGRIPEWMFFFAPKDTLFFWPEFYIQGSWTPLQKVVHITEEPWDSCPFDGAKYQLEPLKKSWILEDQGLWNSPDDYFKKHKPSVHGWRAIGWHLLARRKLNKKLC